MAVTRFDILKSFKIVDVPSVIPPHVVNERRLMDVINDPVVVNVIRPVVDASTGTKNVDVDVPDVNDSEPAIFVSAGNE